MKAQSQTLRMAGRNIGLSGADYVWHILVPAAFPSILAGLKIGGALFHAGSLTLPFLLGATLQLGYLVLYARFFSHTEAAQVREA